MSSKPEHTDWEADIGIGSNAVMEDGTRVKVCDIFVKDMTCIAEVRDKTDGIKIWVKLDTLVPDVG